NDRMECGISDQRLITGKTPSTSNKSLWGGDVQFVTPTTCRPNWNPIVSLWSEIPHSIRSLVLSTISGLNMLIKQALFVKFHRITA
ncbi:MAG: hypothetical protein J7K34_09970, partial [Flavobacteriaceae bacterium]|nr:hypothetical protein [Flavobacteriaceae bacterium]